MNTSIDYVQVLILTEFCVNSERVITRHKTAFLNPGVSKELRNVPGLQRKSSLKCHPSLRPRPQRAARREGRLNSQQHLLTLLFRESL